jgi:VanZ family protein
MPGSFRIDKVLSPRSSRILMVTLALLVLALSLTPRPAAFLGALNVYDKLWHFIAYAALGFFAMRAVDRRGLLSFVVTIAGCTAFGGLIEIIQPLVGRKRDLGDFLINLAGAAIGAAIAALLSRVSRSREESGVAGE